MNVGICPFSPSLSSSPSICSCPSSCSMLPYRSTCINIRNAAKMELNNVSARIYADTFHSQREANLTSYMSDINLSTAYKNALRAGFIEGMKSRVKLTNDDYDVESIDLTFRQYSEKIEYIASFDITYRIRMFGESFPPIRRHAELTGSHNTKF